VDKRKYKRQLAIERRAEKVSYINDLHDALISKSGVNFWKCWRSKFENNNKTGRLIDGLADDAQIAESFAGFFAKHLIPLMKLKVIVFIPHLERDVVIILVTYF